MWAPQNAELTHCSALFLSIWDWRRKNKKKIEEQNMREGERKREVYDYRWINELNN
jgi:hypothetical protein